MHAPSPDHAGRPPGAGGKAWIAGLALFLAAALAWHWAVSTPHLESILGFGQQGRYFDLMGVLAAYDAVNAGADPHALNALDAFGRPFLYSNWWLWPASWGLGRADADWIGGGLVAATLITALWAWPVRSGRELLVAGAMLLSPAWLFAVYRANNDLVIFILLALAIRAAQHPHPLTRAVAAVLAGAMAILKYYPFAAGLVILRAARRRELLILLGLAAAVVMLGWPSLDQAFARISTYAIITTGQQAFGAKVLPELVSAFAPAASGWLAGLAAAGAGFALFKIRPDASNGNAPGKNRHLAAAIAAAVLAVVFFIGMSYTYKLVFAWWLLPWLLHDAVSVLGRAKSVTLLALLIFVCWFDGLLFSSINALAPGWSREARGHALVFLKTSSVMLQLGYWFLIGACLRLATDWSRQQLSRLAAIPGGT